MRNLSTYCLLLCAATTACSPKDPEDTATTTVGTSGASTSSGDASTAPTTGTPTTGASADTSGSESATGSTGNTGSTGPESSSSTGDATSGSTSGSTDVTTGDSGEVGSETDTGVMVACDGSGTSTLDGVCIVFPPQKDEFSLAEVAAGVMFDYVVIVTADVPDVTAEAQKTCDEPKTSGLYMGESVEGDGQNYCICDNGLCPPPIDPPATLKAGEYPASMDWDGKNWNGPSDTNNPKGKPFPPGKYTVKVRTSGLHQGKAFEVTAELPITLTP